MKKISSGLEVYEIAPEDFNHQIQVAACYLEINNELLLLQRAAQVKLEPGKWGIPAGKVENNETPENAAKRELLEETGISFEDSSRYQHLKSLYIRKPEVDYVFHLFKVSLDQRPKVHLSDEHQSFAWVASKDMHKLALMDGAKEALQHFHAINKKT